MEILNVPRGYGKSTRLIMKAVETGYSIIVGKQYLRDLAERITNKEIKIYSAYEFASIDAMKRDKNILIDDLPLVLSILLNTNVEMATMTSGSLESYGIDTINIIFNSHSKTITNRANSFVFC